MEGYYRQEGGARKLLDYTRPGQILFLGEETSGVFTTRYLPSADHKISY